MNEKLAGLSPAKRALLELKLKKRAEAAGLDGQPVRPRARRSPAPLSFNQEVLWLLDQISGTTAYTVPRSMRVRGPLRLEALRKALDAVVARHEVLRTTYAAGDDGKGIQIIAESGSVPFVVTDLSHLPEPAREAEAQRMLVERSKASFDLANDLMIRADVLVLGPEDHYFLCTTHHIASDGVSKAVLYREIAAHYRFHCGAGPAALPELPIQYADWAVWQRQRLAGGALEEQIAYWKNKLAGAPALLELPLDHPRPPIQSSRGAMHSLLLPKAILNALKTLIREEGTTLYMTLLAAFKVLLHRTTGQDDLVVGSPAASRDRPEVENLVGFFVNMLVMRTDLSGDPTFREVVRRVKETALGAYDHQDLPFERLMEELKPARDLSYTPIFQVMFGYGEASLTSAAAAALELEGCSVAPLRVDRGESKFDLILAMAEVPEGLKLTFGYRSDIFEAATIARMTGHFRRLLGAVAHDADQRIGAMPMLTEPERHQVLVDWNDTRRDYPDKCAHELFEEHAAKAPDAMAVVFEDDRITYGELDRRANRVARRLLALGVGVEALVGLACEKSVELVIGLLGILKAGAAYVPMDPALPAERLAHLLSDTKARVIVTQDRVVPGLPPHAANVVTLDGDWLSRPGEDDTSPRVGVSPSNLVYGIFTSGSTGKSKGVLVEHRSLVNQYFAWEEAYELRAVASHLQMAGISFDVFSGDLVRALGSGKTLVLCSRDWLLAPERLYELMLRERVECAEFVPAVLRALVQHLEETNQSIDFMRLCIAGSDVWQVGEYRRLARRLPAEARLVNSFGLTETTIDSTFYEGVADPPNAARANEREVPPAELPSEGNVPIGRPFANTRIYLLDRAGQPVPIGVRGEIHIGGAGVARGYLDRPALTAERFVDAARIPGETGRLYRTGDMARYRADGNLEFLGRTDQQVKIRGFRIELGEIEAALTEHPRVGEAVVVVREDVPGNRRLVAYVVARPGAALSSVDAAELRTYAKSKLPDYMVPSSLMALDALPLSPNGKVDRRALPVPDRSADDEDGFVAPRTPVEEMLVEIWGALLKADRIGVYDNFFELGGHSLLATQVISRVRQTLGVEIALRSIFESPTVAGLAVLVVEKLMEQEGQASDSLPPASGSIPPMA